MRIGKGLWLFCRVSEALEKAYHGTGYRTVLVNIPQQKVGGRMVRLAPILYPVASL